MRSELNWLSHISSLESHRIMLYRDKNTKIRRRREKKILFHVNAEFSTRFFSCFCCVFQWCHSYTTDLQKNIKMFTVLLFNRLLFIHKHAIVWVTSWQRDKEAYQGILATHEQNSSEIRVRLNTYRNEYVKVNVYE